MRQLILPVLVLGLAVGCRPSSTPPSSAPAAAASARNGGLVLPGGFDATVFHEGVGRARHMAVTSDGIVYIKLRGPARGQTPEQFKGVVALRDTGGDGRADQTEYFGDYQDTGDYGTGLRIFEDHLYFATAGEVYRQKLQPGTLVPATPVEMILKHNYRQQGRSYEHIAKPIAFDEAGHLYVPFGAPGDTCQDRNRQPGAPGADPCGQLEMHGGVWQFDARRVGQTEKDGKRYATGIRSLVAMTWNRHVKELYALQHGRDDLYRSWPQYFSRWQSAVLPAEEFFRVPEGFDGGWPYYYFDWMQGKKLLNPEYGGDGKKEGKGASLARPLVGFPGHYAPNDLLFYDGTLFPERYRQGAFIAFHGSTIRMPYSQAGYIVAFVPMKDGQPSGDWEVFADGFAGIDPIPNTGDAAARPMGLAQGPDGALYVTESVKGKVWRVTYTGDRTKFGARQLAAMARRKAEQQHIRNPHETNDVIGKEVFAAGAKIYDTYCVSCHQRDGKGDGARFPPVAGTNWVSGNKQRLISIVVHGLNGEIEVEGRRYNDVMPPHGFLTDEQIAQVLTYLRQNFGNYGQGVLKDEVAAVRTRAPWTPQSQPQQPVGPTPQTPPSPAAPSAGQAPAAPLTWDDVAPLFRPPAEFAGKFGSYRSPLRFDDGSPVRGAADWPRRRAEILATWHGLMGPWPAPLDRVPIEVLSETRRETFTQRRVRLAVAPGQTVEGWLLVPDTRPARAPAVLVPFYEPETSVGLGERPRRDFARQLTRAGFVTLSIGTPAGDARHPDRGTVTAQPLSYYAYVAANAWTALAGLPEVDPARIGVVGHSYGGKWSMFAGALWDRFAAVATSDPGVVFDEARPNVNYWEPWYLGFDATQSRRAGLVTPDNPRTGPYARMIAEGRDLHELHALIAPRPFFVSGGAEDPPERWVALNHAVAVNTLLGATDRVGMSNRETHDPTDLSNAQLVAFFVHALGR